MQWLEWMVLCTVLKKFRGAACDRKEWSIKFFPALEGTQKFLRGSPPTPTPQHGHGVHRNICWWREKKNSNRPAATNSIRRFFRRLRSDLTRSLLNLKNELGPICNVLRTGFSFCFTSWLVEARPVKLFQHIITKTYSGVKDGQMWWPERLWLNEMAHRVNRDCQLVSLVFHLIIREIFFKKGSILLNFVYSVHDVYDTVEDMGHNSRFSSITAESSIIKCTAYNRVKIHW